jgi:hypothetical protein
VQERYRLNIDNKYALPREECHEQSDSSCGSFVAIIDALKPTEQMEPDSSTTHAATLAATGIVGASLLTAPLLGPVTAIMLGNKLLKMIRQKAEIDSAAEP